jgi:hypothetical protein
MTDGLIRDFLELVIVLLIVAVYIWKQSSSNEGAQNQQGRQQQAGRVIEKHPSQPARPGTAATGFRPLRIVAGEAPASFARGAPQKRLVAGEPSRPTRNNAEAEFTAQKVIVNEDAPCFIHGVPQRECKERH